MVTKVYFYIITNISRGKRCMQISKNNKEMKRKVGKSKENIITQKIMSGE